MRDVISAINVMSLAVVITDVLGMSFVKDSARTTVLMQPFTGVEEDLQTVLYRKNMLHSRRSTHNTQTQIQLHYLTVYSLPLTSTHTSSATNCTQLIKILTIF